MINGILPVDKPMGWTSHDVVARIRRVAGQREVGHAGTLDPLATGVVVLVLGAATRLSAYLMATSKTYCAEIVLGATTVTDDAEAPLSSRRNVSHLALPEIEAAVRHFVGEIDQIPPSYAAVKRDGKKLYELARKGIEIAPVTRRVTIDAIEILAWDSPRLRCRVRCAAGTYIRSLARDIGNVLGVGGYLHALRRVASGSFSDSDTCRLDDLADLAAIARAVQPLDRAVLRLPALVLDAEQSRKIGHGQPISTRAESSTSAVQPDSSCGTLRLYQARGDLLALGQHAGTTVRPIRVFVREERARHT